MMPPFAVGVAAGEDHACAWLRDGRVECWGNNAYGQVGSDYLDSIPTPQMVAGLDCVSKLSAGDGVTCAVQRTGAIQCWGVPPLDNLYTSDAGVSHFWAPSPVVGVARMVDVSVGVNIVCGEDLSAALSCWGNAIYAGCALGSMLEQPPTAVAGFDRASAFGVGANLCAAIDAGVICEGPDFCVSDGGAPMAEPVSVPGVQEATRIAAAFARVCVVQADGTVQCMGENANGELGDGTTTNRWTFQPVLGVSGALGVALGGTHVCAWLKNGTAQCWGSDASGALGDSPDAVAPKRLVAVHVPGLTGVVSMAAGFGFTCALISDGSVMCWGLNDYGQVGVGGYGAVTSPARVHL